MSPRPKNTRGKPLYGWYVTAPDGVNTRFVRAHTERGAKIEGIRALRHAGIDITDTRAVAVRKDPYR
jgi:hypothetical protein